MKTVLNLLSDACVKFPSSTYVSDKYTGGAWLPRTFIDVDVESNYIASGLLEYGFGINNKISILSEGRSTWVISEFATLKIKGTAVPLSVKLLPEELVFRINHSESKAIVISKFNIEKLGPVWNQIEIKDFKIIYLDSDDTVINSLLEKYPIPKDAIIRYDELLEKGKSSYQTNAITLQEIRNTITEDDVVTISYTSGTSGNPKGAMLTHLNYYTNAKDSIEYMNLPNNWKLFIMLPVDHSFAHTVGIFISCFIAIGVHFVDSSEGPRQTLKNIPINLQEIKPDFIITVPALSASFMGKIKDGIESKGGFAKWLFNKGLHAGIKLNNDGYTKSGIFTKIRYSFIYFIANKLVFSKVRNIFGGNIKMCVGGGALLDIRQQLFFAAIGVPIYQGYGLTEAAPVISVNSITAHKFGSSGRIVNNLECKIIADEKEVPNEQKGEIVIRGNNVMKGYFKNPTASDEVLRDGWLYTGDMGYYDEDKFLYVVGRAKALLISEDGEKYSPEEIEEAIMNSSNLVSQVMVYNDHKQFTSALISIDETKLKEYCKKHKLTNADDILTHITKSFYTFKSQSEYKGAFAEKWIPTIYRIVLEPFSEENKMINSTLKMVRFKITEVYQDLLAEMYSGGSGNIACEHNLNVIKKIMVKS